MVMRFGGWLALTGREDGRIGGETAKGSLRGRSQSQFGSCHRAVQISHCRCGRPTQDHSNGDIPTGRMLPKIGKAERSGRTIFTAATRFFGPESASGGKSIAESNDIAKANFS